MDFNMTKKNWIYAGLATAGILGLMYYTSKEQRRQWLIKNLPGSPADSPNTNVNMDGSHYLNNVGSKIGAAGAPARPPFNWWCFHMGINCPTITIDRD